MTSSEIVLTGELGVKSPTSATDSAVRLHAWCKAQMPTGWQGTPGRIARARVAGRLGVGLVSLPKEFKLSLPWGVTFPLPCFAGDQAGLDRPGPAELAQRVPIGSGCHYLLRLRYYSKVGKPSERSHIVLAPASWQIAWFGAAGQVLAVDGETLDPRRHRSECRLVAPPEATEAELRFIQPAYGVLALDVVSFMPASQGLRNRDWQDWEDDTIGCKVPVGWDHLAGWVDQELNPDNLVVGTQLLGDGPEDAVLVQMVNIVAGKTYDLQVVARPATPPPASQEALRPDQRARLELYWLDNAPVGAPIILPLDGRDFPRHAWSGVAPAGATRAEIRLVQPKGLGNLVVREVSLEERDLVNVPLTFLAEAPGQLTVSNLRVAYDLPEPPAPLSVPASVSAQSQRTIAKQQTVVPRVAPATLAAGPSPLVNRPIDILAGVGTRFTRILSKLPTSVTTIAALAAIDPQASIAGVQPERLLELKTAAEMVMDIGVEAGPLAALANESLETLLAMTPTDLAQRAGQSLVQAEQVQRKLRALRMLIKNDVFRTLMLSDVMSGGR